MIGNGDTLSTIMAVIIGGGLLIGVLVALFPGEK